MSTFGDILKELRLKHGLTQKAVAEHLSISPPLILYMKKENANQNTKHLKKLLIFSMFLLGI